VIKITPYDKYSENTIDSMEKQKEEMKELMKNKQRENGELVEKFKRKYEKLIKMLDNLDYDKLIAANVVLKLLDQDTDSKRGLKFTEVFNARKESKKNQQSAAQRAGQSRIDEATKVINPNNTSTLSKMFGK